MLVIADVTNVTVSAISISPCVYLYNMFTNDNPLKFVLKSGNTHVIMKNAIDIIAAII